MPSLKAGFLLIGPWEARLSAELGAHLATDLNQARQAITETTYDVIALPMTSVLEKKFQDFFLDIKTKNPATQFLPVVPKDFSADQLSELHEHYHFFRILSSYQDPELEAHLFAALEESNQRKQDENLALLIREQTDKLKKLQIELEQRVEKRTKFLTEARRKLFLTNSRIEGLKRSLMAAHKATSLGDIEKLLSEALASSVQISWIRIFFDPQDQLFAQQVNEQLNFNQLRVPLYRQHEAIGSIFFMRAPNRHFLREESDFLTRVAEAVSLALDRLQKLQESEALKEQWETTFNSMSDPVVLIDANYDIVQANKALNKRLEAREANEISQKCHKVLFNRDEPCPNCQRGTNFRVESTHTPRPHTFEVYSQSLVLEPQKPGLFVNLYHNITEQLKMERQILETAKMAELGTIGSSIAHELNNPLGGILSFTQLIKMDLPQDHPFYPDIVEMENGVQRCKDIVQNLLGFTRNPNVDELAEVSLQDVCNRALKILELQTKSLGIHVVTHFPVRDCKIFGHLNLLSQAVKNVLQNAIDGLSDKIRSQQGFRGILDITLEESPDRATLTIRDNNSAQKNSNLAVGLALPVATQILRDHEAVLETTTGGQGEGVAKISFSRPVLGS
jgi:C4-dicarboxylate-specific signal transduction histidine kinase